MHWIEHVITSRDPEPVSVMVPWRVICFANATTMTSVNLPWCYPTLQAPPSLHEETRLVTGRPPWTNLRDNTNHRCARRRASWNSAKIPVCRSCRSGYSRTPKQSSHILLLGYIVDLTSLSSRCLSSCMRWYLSIPR